MSADPIAPVAESERVPLFDVLRGFALFGILLVNFWGPVGEAMPRLDAVVNQALIVLVDSSFYPLFSFLFGLGFAVQLMRARAGGRHVEWLYLRRMLALFLIGSAHAVLIWRGDILVTYAFVGLFLIPLHRLPQKAVLALALVMMAAQFNEQVIVREVSEWRNARRAAEAELLLGARNEATRIEAIDRRLANEGNSTWWSTTVTRWNDHARDVRSRTDLTRYPFSDILLAFLVGLLVGRARILHDAVAHRRGIAVVCVVALLAATGGFIIDQTPGGGGLLERASGWAQAVLVRSWWFLDIGLTVFYVTALTLAFTFTERGRRMLGVFAAPGRMGLTNYLMQSVVMTALSMPYGLGWRPSTTLWLALNVAFFFGVQVPLSRWWLAHYRFGPAEWLWRTMTYGSAQPMRRQVSESLARPVVAPAA